MYVGDSHIQLRDSDTGRSRRLLNTANILTCVVNKCVKQERDNAPKQYSAETMQMRSQSLQPATWATLTVRTRRFQRMEIRNGGHLDLKHSI